MSLERWASKGGKEWNRLLRSPRFWRKRTVLSGSRCGGHGAGGTIVEQDILNYLSRIMSGEEEPPETPVDLPPPDWEGDLANSNFDMAALSEAGVDSDITSFIEHAGPLRRRFLSRPPPPLKKRRWNSRWTTRGRRRGSADHRAARDRPAAQTDVPEVAAAAVMPEPEPVQLAPAVPEPVASEPLPEVQPAAAMVPERIVVPEPVQPSLYNLSPSLCAPNPFRFLLPLPWFRPLPLPARAAWADCSRAFTRTAPRRRTLPLPLPYSYACPMPSMVGPAFATPKAEVPGWPLPRSPCRTSPRP